MLVSQTVTDHNLPRPFTQRLVGEAKEEGREEEESGDFDQDSILQNVIILMYACDLVCDKLQLFRLPWHCARKSAALSVSKLC